MPAENAQATGWRALFLVNKGMKLLSLIVAIVVWYGIRGIISYEAVVEDLPVVILHDEGWAVHEGAGQTVDVRFRGARSDVRDLARDQVTVTIDARGDAVRGVRTVTLTPRHVRGPSGARPMVFRPEQVSFSLDLESEKTVTVAPDLQGQMPDGFEVDRMVVTPESVVVRAPSAHLDAMEVIRTMPVDLDGRIQSFRVRRTLLPPGPARADPDRVQVEVTIREHASVREITAVPVLVLLSPGREAPRVSPAEVRVELQGRPDALRGLDPGVIRAYIEADRPAPERTFPVRVHVPAGIRVVQVDPEAVALETP